MASPPRRLAFAAIVAILALGIGIIAPSSVIEIRAQGGDQLPEGMEVVGYQWVIGSNFSPICVGESKTVEVSIFALVRFPNGSQTGRVRMRVIAASETPDLLSADYAQTPMFGSPTSNSVIITGKAPGRASVSVTSVPRYSQTPPIPGWNQQSFPVEVIRCTYSVEASSIWVTTIDGANVLFTAQLEHTHLQSEDGIVFDSDGYPTAVRWSATVNRVRGCLPDHETFSPPVPAASLSGEIHDDEFILTINLHELVGGGILFECNGHVLTTGRIRSCNDYRDAVCDLKIPNPTLMPEVRLIRFPIDGGTTSVPMRLSYSQGNTQGTAIVTLLRE